MKTLLFTISFILALFYHSYAEVKAARVFTDHMVLQREKPIKIWGWADPKEEVFVTFDNLTKKITADKAGKWSVIFPAQTAGGPYTIQISSSENGIILSDILIGDVWLASGQSNMEWPLTETNMGEDLISQSNNPNLRLFTVEKAMAAEPHKDVKNKMGWVVSSPENTASFSAVAYNFGLKILKDTEVPIGLIHSSWGGTDIETWMSWNSLNGTGLTEGLDKSTIVEKMKNSAEKLKAFESAIEANIGESEKWFNYTSETNTWKVLPVPGLWENNGLGNEDGVIWFARSFDVQSDSENMSANIHLGPVDDWDKTYINGQLIGETNNWQKERIYSIDKGLLKKGINWIVVKVIDSQGGGGMYGASDEMNIEIGDEIIPLAGQWRYQPEVLSSDYGVTGAGPNEYPSLLYNAMIAPLDELSIAGVIWYQGENNTRDPKAYQDLFPKMINDWRTNFNQNFTFLWVQLANFLAPVNEPSESRWAELREAQDMALSLQKTGQAVIIDLGEANDIHPRNKKDVGDRLALVAEKVHYQMEVVSSGPRFTAMDIRDGKAILSFSNIGSGLNIKDKYGYLKGFSIAGEDGMFRWAKAELKENQVIVYHPSIASPRAVRYAWGDNPDQANLYNKEGLPAAPFRTDTQK